MTTKVPGAIAGGAKTAPKREPVGDVNTAAMDSLKVLDPERPIREADIIGQGIEAPSLAGFHSAARCLLRKRTIWID
jgi:hypothetical protein